MEAGITAEQIREIYEEAWYIASTKPVVGLEREDVAQEMAEAGFIVADSWDPGKGRTFRVWVRGSMRFRLGHLFQEQNRYTRKTGWLAVSVGGTDDLAKMQAGSSKDQTQRATQLGEYLYAAKLSEEETRVLAALEEYGTSVPENVLQDCGIASLDRFKSVLHELYAKAGWTIDSGVRRQEAPVDVGIEMLLDHLEFTGEERRVVYWLKENGLGGKGCTRKDAAAGAGLELKRFNKIMQKLAGREDLYLALTA